MKRFVPLFLCSAVLALQMDLTACTAFLVARGDTVFVGNNEDYFNPSTKMWFIPRTDGQYGRVCFGFDDFNPQGGMNEKGLFFDGFATEPLEVVGSRDKPVFNGNLADKAMAECADVEEVVRLFSQYDLGFLKRAMLMFGDAEGNSVIIEGDAFVFKRGSFQICTNFRQSKTARKDVSCRRYLKTDAILTSNQTPAADLCRSILDSVHVEYTQYSNVYDLRNRMVTLYHFHDFSHGVTFRLMDELKKGKRSLDIPSIFPQKDEFRRRYHGKTTPLNSGVMRFFAILCGFVFFLTPFLLHLGRERLKDEENRKGKDISRLYTAAQISLTLGSVLALVYWIVVSRNSQIFTLGPPRSLSGFPFMIKFLIHVPAIEIELVLCSVVLLTLACLKRLWSVFLRIFYAVVTLLLAVHLALFFYWGLVKWIP